MYFKFRLKEEYGVETVLDLMPYKYSAWLLGDPKTLKKITKFVSYTGYQRQSRGPLFR